SRGEGNLLLTQEIGHELHHPRVREHRRGRMVWDQPGRGDGRVGASFEELGPGAAKSVGVHRSVSLSVTGGTTAFVGGAARPTTRRSEPEAGLSCGGSAGRAR